MSLTGEVHKISGDVRRAINNIARQGMLDMSGNVIGTTKIVGYVCDIHEDGDLAGTIDVQEYNYEPDEYVEKGAGHHAGVLLSAIQDNKSGFLIVPMLYSDVVIVSNPTDGHEYVLMYSHAKRIQLNAHEDIEIGVTEVEEFVETDDGLEKDYDELEPTKNKTSTHYSPTSITDTITSPDDEVGYKEEKTVTQKTITVGDTIITISGTSVSIQTSGNVELKVNETTITETDGNLTIKTDKANIEGSDVTVNGKNVTITGGKLTTKGTSSTDLRGPFNSIKVCPFSGAPHCGSSVSGT